MKHSDADLKPDRTKPKPLTWDQARTMSKPRRCNVPWEHRGGCLCCDLCTNRAFTFTDEGRSVVRCMSSDDPRLFRPRWPNDEF